MRPEEDPGLLHKMFILRP